MTQDTAVSLDIGKLDRLMSLSGELVIVRSQYVRLLGLLQQDLARQKGLSQGLERMRSLVDGAVKDPARSQKALAELGLTLNDLDQLARYDELIGHIQSMSDTTSALEKASSELQSGIAQVRIDASGDSADAVTAMKIISALLVIVGGEIYAFPLSSVTEIINVPKKDIYTIDGNTTVKLRDHALSLIELSNVIQAAANTTDENGPVKRVVVVTDGTDRLGVLVDGLLGKDEIVLKSLTRHFAGVKGIVGASILADSSIALILDPATIISESK